MFSRFFKTAHRERWQARFGQPIPLLALIQYVEMLIKKCQSYKLQPENLLAYIRSLEDYHSYNAWSTTIFQNKAVRQQLYCKLKNIPMRYQYKPRPIVSIEDLHRASNCVLRNGCLYNDVVVLTIAIIAFSSLARTYELLHAIQYEPMKRQCLYSTRSGSYRIWLPHPKVHKGYLQELQPISLPANIHATLWISVMSLSCLFCHTFANLTNTLFPSCFIRSIERTYLDLH